MGLFGNKIVLRKEYFVSCYNMDKYAISDFRKRQGFNVTMYTDGGALNVCAEMKSFLRYLKITNKIYVFGGLECEFDFYGLESLEDTWSFLRQHFTPVPKNVRFRFPDGVSRDYYTPSVYLPDGNVLAWKSSSGSDWFCLHIISQDRIIIK